MTWLFPNVSSISGRQNYSGCRLAGTISSANWFVTHLHLGSSWLSSLISFLRSITAVMGLQIFAARPQNRELSKIWRSIFWSCSLVAPIQIAHSQQRLQRNTENNTCIFDKGTGTIDTLVSSKLTKGHRHHHCHRLLTVKPFLYPGCPAPQTARGHCGCPVPHLCRANIWTLGRFIKSNGVVKTHGIAFITWTLSNWSRWVVARRRTPQVWRWRCLSSSTPTKSLWEEPARHVRND